MITLPKHTGVESAFDKEHKEIILEREMMTKEYLKKGGDIRKLYQNYTGVHYITRMLIDLKWYKETGITVSEDKFLVPDNIVFLDNDGDLLLYFNKKSLGYNHAYDDWFVGNYNTEEVKNFGVKCELVLTSYSNVEIGERYIRQYTEGSYRYGRQDLYCLKTAERTLIRLNNNGKEVIENSEDDWIVNGEVYRVIPVE